MAVTKGGFTNLASGTGTRNWTSPTTASKAYGVVVISGGAVDETTGVTWGGVAMARAATGANTGGENGTTSCWFIDAPGTGGQTVEITRSGSTAYIATAFDGTSATGHATYTDTQNVGWDTYVSTASSLSTTSLTIPSGRVVAMYGGCYSGENLLSSVTANADLTDRNTQDFGNFVSQISDKTTVYTGTGSAYTNFNYTQSNDDMAVAVLAVHEATAAVPGSFTANAVITKTITPTAFTANAVITKTVTSGLSYVKDLFERSEATGWGNADVGGAWSTDNSSELSVSGGYGVHSFAATGSANAEPLSTSFGDAEGSLRWSWNDISGAGNTVYTRIHVRTQNGGADGVRFEVRHAATGAVGILIRKTVSTTLTTLDTNLGYVTGYTADTWLNFKWQTQVSGADLIFRYKLWKDGDSEPSWYEYTATSIDSVLLNAGTLEIVSQDVDGSVPAGRTVRYDNLNIGPIGGGGLTLDAYIVAGATTVPGDFTANAIVLVTVVGIDLGVTDDFERTVADGLGTASDGQLWTVDRQTSATVSVSGSYLVVTGTGPYLKAHVPAPPVSRGSYVGAVQFYGSVTNSATVHLGGSDGADTLTWAGAGIYVTGGKVYPHIGSSYSGSGLTALTTDVWRFRVEFDGTTVRVRIWKGTEPTDWSSPNGFVSTLSQAGAANFGLRVSGSSTHTIRVLSIDGMTDVGQVADAVILKTQLKTFATNAVIKRTWSSEEDLAPITVDASILGEETVVPGDFTADAVIFASSGTKTFTADAVIQGTIPQSFASDAVVLASSGTKTFTADATIVSTQPGSFTANAVIKATISPTLTADAIQLKTWVFGQAGGGESTVIAETFSGSGALAGTTADTGGTWVDLSWGATPYESSGLFTCNGGFEGSWAAMVNSTSLGDGYVQADLSAAAGTAGFSNGLILRRNPTTSACYTFQRTNDGSWEAFRLSAVGGYTNIGSGSGAARWARFSATGDSPTTLRIETRSTQGALGTGWNILDTTDNTADNQRTSGRVGCYMYSDLLDWEETGDNLDNFLAVDTSGTPVDGPGPTMDAFIMGGETSSFSANAVVKGTQPGSATANAVISKTQSYAFAADAVVLRTQADSFTANSVIKKTITPTFTANAVILANSGEKTFSADAVILLPGIGAEEIHVGTFSGPSWDYSPGEWTLDAWESTDRVNNGLLANGLLHFSPTGVGGSVLVTTGSGYPQWSLMARVWLKGDVRALVGTFGLGEAAEEPAFKFTISETELLYNQGFLTDTDIGAGYGAFGVVGTESFVLVKFACYSHFTGVDWQYDFRAKVWPDGSAEPGWQRAWSTTRSNSLGPHIGVGAQEWIPVSYRDVAVDWLVTAQGVSRVAAFPIWTVFTADAVFLKPSGTKTLTANAFIVKPASGSATADAILLRTMEPAGGVGDRWAYGTYYGNGDTAPANVYFRYASGVLHYRVDFGLYVDGLGGAVVGIGAYGVDEVQSGFIDTTTVHVGSNESEQWAYRAEIWGDVGAVTIRAKTWKVGESEPGWQLTVTDDNPNIPRTDAGLATAAYVDETLNYNYGYGENEFGPLSELPTIDAVISRTQSDSISVDAVILKAIASDVAASAVILRTQSWSFASDSVILAPSGTNTFSANATIMRTETDSLAVDAWLAGAFTLDAEISGLVANSFAVDAVASATVPGAPILLDAVTRATILDTFDLDAIALREQEGSFALEAIFLATTSESPILLNAVIARTKEESLSADALIIATQPGSFEANAAILGTNATSFPADAWLAGRFALDASLSGRIDVDAFILAGTFGFFELDAWIAGPYYASLTLDSVVLGSVAESLSASATIMRTETDSIGSDAIVLAPMQWTLHVDAVVLGGHLFSWSCDAITLRQQPGSLSVDAVVLGTQERSLSANAAILSQATDSFSANSAINSVGRCIWTTPGNTVQISGVATLSFLMPEAAASNMHFEIQIDTVDTFDGVDLRIIKSHADPSGWEYFDGADWQPIPQGGVSNTYCGNEARYTIQTPLANETWYRRVRAGVIG